MMTRQRHQGVGLLTLGTVAAAMLAAPSLTWAQDYTAIKLDSFRPLGLSTQGPVVAGQLGDIAAIWENEITTELGTLTDGLGSIAYDVNNLRQVVGSSYVDGAQNIRAFLWEDNAMVELGGLDVGLWSEAFSINELGQVAGHAQFDEGRENGHAFFYADGVMTDLGVLMGGTQSAASGVNLYGEVVGESDVEGGLRHGFLWQGTDLIDLGVLGEGGESEARGINDAGLVVGWSTLGSGLGRRAFQYSDGEMMDLGTVPLSDESGANAINTHGVIVGYVVKASGAKRAAIWRDGVVTDLNMLVSGCAGWELEDAVAINDEGQIICIGRRYGNPKACILNPVQAGQSGLVIEGPFPGLAGMVNTVRVTGVVPGGRIFFIYSGHSGCTSVRRCEDLYVGMDSPVVDSVYADENGVAELTAYVTTGASGRTGLVQAIEASSCRVSDQLAHTFP